MRIIVFGLGKIYRDNAHLLPSQDKIVAYMDNNKELYGQWIDNVKVVSPMSIADYEYDKVVIMSSYTNEIKQQLLHLGVSEDRIVYGLQYIFERKIYHIPQSIFLEKRKQILIVTNNLGYHGGAMVCIFLANALRENGYSVTIVASEGDIAFINEYRQKGIQLEVLNGVQYAKLENLGWISKFDLVITNTYPMILLALEICKSVKTVLWLHESKNVYIEMRFWYSDIKEKLKKTKLKIYAVSEMARDNFCEEVGYQKEQVTIFEYGIPFVPEKRADRDESVTFAVIGTVFPFKQQKLFIDAVERLNNKQQKNNSFWIIGKIANQEYAKKILKQIENKPYIQYLGEKSQKELSELYDKIDVIVVCSKQESLPIVVVEGFMRRKTCIICDNTGMSQYITNKVDAYIYKTNEVEELAAAIQYFLENKNVIRKMGENARRIYEENFSPKKFKMRLQKEIDRLEKIEQ